METIQRDATGRQIQVLSTDSQPVAGDSLTLTIDTKMQKQAQTAVDWAMRASQLKSAVLIAMNPQTGEILAMVSTPTYDDNDFAQGITNAQFQALLKNPDKPLLNHAISEQFPEGSTYKLVTGTGALADGKLTPTTLVQTHAYIQIGADKFWDWNHARLRATSTSRPASPTRATRSSTRSPRCSGSTGWPTGPTSTASAHRPASTCPARSPGIVPDEPVEAERRSARRSCPARSSRPGIGQGFDTSTPLQLLNAYAALANGGTLYQPQVVRQVTGPDGIDRARLQADRAPQDRRAGQRLHHDAEAARHGRHRPAHLQPRR